MSPRKVLDRSRTSGDGKRLSEASDDVSTSGQMSKVSRIAMALLIAVLVGTTDKIG